MPRIASTNKSPDILTREWIQRVAERAVAHLSSTATNGRRLRRRGFEAAALDPEVLAIHNRRYSCELTTGPIRNQEQSGRCWLFAPIVLAQTAAIRDCRIKADVSLSANYLYFFNLLEQANATVDDLQGIALRRERLAASTIRRLLLAEVMGLGDGGEWEWAFGLIDKYGLVPDRDMPETASSKRTKALAVELHECFAQAARIIHRTPENHPVVRMRLVKDVVRVLVAHLGCPPRFVRAGRRTVSPTSYATEVVDFSPSEWRIIISNPLLQRGRVYQRRASAIISGAPGFNLKRLNVSQRRFAELVRESLEAGYAVGFSADVDRNDIDHRRGIMHPAIYNRVQVYRKRIIRDLPRRDDIYFGLASSKHAMVISGFESAGSNKPPIKYKVINSWGSQLGDSGVYHMYSAWFEENVFKLAVHETVLNKRERKAYDDPIAAPGGTFY